MKIVIADASWGDVSVERSFLPEDAELVYGNCKTEEEVIALCHDADGIMAEYAPITERVIKALEHCKVISNSATGYDNIDVESAKAHGIMVANVKHYCTEEVATHAMSLLLSHNQKLFAAAAAGQKIGWPGTENLTISRLSEQTLGLIGYGSIAQAVAKRAEAFGMRILANTSVPESVLEQHGVEPASLERIYAESDVISLHRPLGDQSRNMVDQGAFASMEKRPYIINTSRGGLIDEDALAQALDLGLVRGAALDVICTEPLSQACVLRNRENVVITPHIAFYSTEALYEVRMRSALNVTNFLAGNREAVSLV